MRIKVAIGIIVVLLALGGVGFAAEKVVKHSAESALIVTSPENNFWIKILIEQGIQLIAIIAGVLFISLQIRSGFAMQRESKKLDLYLQIYNDIFDKVNNAKILIKDLSGRVVIYRSYLENPTVVRGLRMERFAPNVMMTNFQNTGDSINEIVTIIDKYSILLLELTEHKEPLISSKARYNGLFMSCFQEVMPFLPIAIQDGEQIKPHMQPPKKNIQAIRESSDNFLESKEVLLAEIDTLLNKAQGHLLSPLEK
jgi:hypothetical protein